MPKPMGKGKRRTKRTYLGSGAGSLKSGTGATAKKPKKSRPFIPTIFPTRPKPEGRKIRTFPIPKKEFRPITPKSPATGLATVFVRSLTEAKKQRKRMATTMRKKAKR